MKNLISFSSLAFFIAIVISSCDYVSAPFEDPTNGGPDTTGDTTGNQVQYRKILIEDFTGQKCGNCPEAAIIASGLHDIYGEQLIIVGVHAGFFANPSTSGMYSTDFRTTAGDEYNSTYENDVAGNPNGFVNRSKIVNNNIIINPSSWGVAVDQISKIEAEVDLKLEVTYDSGDNSIDVDITTESLKPVNGDYNLVLYLVEDSIVDWQKDYSLPSGQQDVDDYVHRHVLRDNINSTWGEQIMTGSIGVGEIFSKSYTNYIIDNSWDVNHCSVIAYIYKDDSNADNREIIQVEEKHVVE